MNSNANQLQLDGHSSVGSRAQQLFAAQSWRWVAVVTVAVVGAGAAHLALAKQLDYARPASWVSYTAVSIAGLTYLLIRHAPFVTLLTIIAAQLIVAVDAGQPFLGPLAFATLFMVSRTGQRRHRLIITISAAATMILAVGLLTEESFLAGIAHSGAWMLPPIAIADAKRARDERTLELIDAEATERVMAERLRIARDLHDVVAHGLSMIAIQSGVAAHLVERDTKQAHIALDAINAISKESLGELRTMLGVLRSTDIAPLKPAPSDPDDISDLVDAATQSGLSITLVSVGQFPPNASDTSVIAFHRILQEALTNVARHAGQVTTCVSITHNANHVTLEIENNPRVHPDYSIPSTGVGITGMTERAEMLGGTLVADTTSDGGFNVTATVPYQHGAS